ncbi:MAG: insulinase family protein [Paludibacteraceae bacterium]|nr:insulinase family protein [Paludibacteraceae bacterium]
MQKNKLRNALFLGVLLSVSAVVFAQEPGAGNSQSDPMSHQMPVDTAYRIGHLPNGLTYYIRHNNYPDQRADFYLAQRVGSILEEPQQRGLAHFLEHMAFNGLRHFEGKSMTHWLETIGVQFGGNLNAYTSVDKTVYMIKNVPVGRQTVVDSCLLVLRDWSDGILLEDAEIDKERGVIEEEWRTRNNFLLRMYEQIFPRVYAGDKYADCMPIGNIDVVRHFAYDDLRAYYQKWYRPDLQGIIVVGDVDVNEVEHRIQEMFSDCKVTDGAPERIYYPVTDNRTPIVTYSYDKESPFALVELLYKYDGVPDEYKNTDMAYVQDVVYSLVSSMANFRLEELLQQSAPPFSQADFDNGDFLLSQTKQAWQLQAVCSVEQCRGALEQLLVERERWVRYGFTPTELERAKADLLTAYQKAYAERKNQDNSVYVDECLRNFTEKEPMPGLEVEYSLVQRLMPVLTIDMVNQMIHRDTTNLVVWLAGPEGSVLPSQEEVLSLIGEVRSRELQPYVDKGTQGPLLRFEPEPGRVVKTKLLPDSVTGFVLSNGVRVQLKTTGFRQDEVRIIGFSKGGFAATDLSDPKTLKMVNDLADIGGYGEFSLIDLYKALAGKNYSFTASVRNNCERWDAWSTVTDVETLFQLLYLSFTDRRRDEDAFNSYLSRQNAALKNNEANPMSEWQDSIISVLYDNQPLFMRVRAADLQQVDYDYALRTLSDRFSNAADFTFFVVGNISPDSLKPLLERYVATLPASGKRERYCRSKLNPVKGTASVRYEKTMENPKTVVLLHQWDYLPVNLANVMTLDALCQVLDIVYTEKVREDEGGTYGVSVNATTYDDIRDYYTFSITFTTDSAKVDRLLPIVDAEITRIAEEGPRPADLQKVKEYMRKVYFDRQKDNGYWISVMYDREVSKLDRQTDYLKRLDRMTGTDLQRMARQLLKSKNRKRLIHVGVK